MPTIQDPSAPVNPSLPVPTPRKPFGFAETTHLELDENGVLHLKPHEGADDDCRLGHIEDADVPQEYTAEFVWLLGEWRDGVRFARGCHQAAEGAFRDAQGDASKW